MPTSTTIRRTSFFMEPPSECVDPEELAEACGNRTHRSRVPPAPNGFEVRAGHQPRCASVRRVKYNRTQAKFEKRVIGSRGLRLRFLCGFLALRRQLIKQGSGVGPAVIQEVAVAQRHCQGF